MPQPTTYPKLLSVIVNPDLFRKFTRRCRSERLIGQAVLRALVELYLKGHIDIGPNRPLHKKPYRAFLTFKSDVMLYERLMRRSREIGIPAGAIVRRLTQSFSERELDDRFDRFVRDSAPFVPGTGGRGWKGRRPDSVRRRRAAAHV